MPGVAVRDLSPSAFKRFKEYAHEGDRLPAKSLTLKRAELAERLRLTEAGMLKRAALLLFHADPERWFTGAYVKIGMFRSESDLAYHDEVHGDLFTQMEQTVELLRTKYMVAWISYRGLQRLETFPIPREALREAVLNALIHKDYSSGTPIQIRVYPDELRIWNPGELPPTWTAANLLRPHESRPPNPDTANTFFRAGLIEAWGRGYEKIRDACREAGAPEPTVELDGGVRLAWQCEVPDRAEQVARPGATEVADPVADPVERLLRRLEAEPLAPSRLQVALGLRHRPTFKENYLRPALAEGLVEMTIPDKPNSRLQRYRLTPAGKARLTATRRQRDE